MKQFNRYQRRLTLALLVSALLNLTLLAALSVAFRPVSAEGAAPPVYPKLAVAFLPSATNPVADDAVEAPRKTVQTEAPEERLIESLRDTPPVSDTFAEAATVPPTAGVAPADGAPGPPRGEAGQKTDTDGLSGPPAEQGGSRPSQDEFLILLQELISENLVYPRRAQQRGIEGTVVLELTIDADGMLRSKRIERESGSSMLDRAAMALLETVFPVPLKPGYDLDCSVSVSYRLN